MKSFIQSGLIFPALFTIIVLGTSCESILDVDSDRLVMPEEHQLNSSNDTVYSMISIFSRMEKLANRYVLLGELRGELMDITDNADTWLQQINNFEITPDNPYNKVSDYYTVINNCNYLIQNIDTSIIAKAEKVMYKQFAAAKAVRAWTYLQIALNYGGVKYYEHAILNIEDASQYDELNLDQLLPLLIDDLVPWRGTPLPGGIALGEDISSDELYFPVRFVLGDLYLWSGEYEKAAREYYDLMVSENYILNASFTSTWTVDNGVFVERDPLDQYWRSIFNLTNTEQITLIAGSTELGKRAEMRYITLNNPEVYPSAAAIENWDNQVYYHTASDFTFGDLRGEIGSYNTPEYYNLTDYNRNLIIKYMNMSDETSKAIIVNRVAHLYLRYAEAVNRAGKPNLAFAVIKHGMNSQTLEVDSIVPRKEKYISYTDSTGAFYKYVDFEDITFDFNVGVRSRGCGNIDLATDFIIPALGSLEDSILYVEDLIIEELALETAFEGNRFHDLMRVALRRNKPAYLAEKVASKHTDNREVIQSKLMDISNWYLP